MWQIITLPGGCFGAYLIPKPSLITKAKKKEMSPNGLFNNAPGDSYIHLEKNVFMIAFHLRIKMEYHSEGRLV